MKMIKKITSILVFLLIAGTVCAQVNNKKEAFLIGGGCDFTEDNFVTEFNEWHSFLKDYGWHVQTFLDPARKTDIDHVMDFDWDTFKERLSSLARREVVPEQVFLGIITHGKIGADGHQICVGNHEYKPIKELGHILTRLQEKGTKVAVVDMSCYSAYSVLELLGSASCVMSMAGREVATGAITKAVASGLSSLPFLEERPSVEDVYFSVLENSNKRMRQLPEITSFASLNTVFVEQVANYKSVRTFFEEEKPLLEHLFSPYTIKGIEEFFRSGRFIANSHGILALMYLTKFPDRQDRPCANFYF
ncbi:MAG: hypothetical protein IKL48_06490 [Elusimicrobiaceae bacterium]|nr:hypothetical protein [Elusimicrobiaceae bacterium]